MAKVKKIAGPLVRTVKVKLLKGVVLGGGVVGRIGEIYELPRHLGTQLIFSGQAEITTEGDQLQHDETPEEEKKGYSAATLESPTARDPKPTRRG
jgi:hypothetical protein